MVYFCQRCACSLGFFGPWHREQVNEEKFKSRGSDSGTLTNVDDDEDTKSVSSMHELHPSASQTEVSIFTNKQSNYSPPPPPYRGPFYRCLPLPKSTFWDNWHWCFCTKETNSQKIHCFIVDGHVLISSVVILIPRCWDLTALESTF